MENILWRHTHQKHLLTNIFRMFLAVLYLLNNIPVPADPVNSKEGHKVDFNKVHVSREGNDNEKSICSQSKNTSTLNPNISRRSLSQLDSQNEVEEDVSHNEVSQDNQSISSNPRLRKMFLIMKSAKITKVLAAILGCQLEDLVGQRIVRKGLQL
jgi:hypothetical protein